VNFGEWEKTNAIAGLGKVTRSLTMPGLYGYRVIDQDKGYHGTVRKLEYAGLHANGPEFF
jgi:hypothetical protein